MNENLPKLLLLSIQNELNEIRTCAFHRNAKNYRPFLKVTRTCGQPQFTSKLIRKRSEMVDNVK